MALRVSDSALAKKIFGQRGPEAISWAIHLQKAIRKKDVLYKIDAVELDSDDPGSATAFNRAYSQDIIHRMHSCAALSLFRNADWLDATLRAYRAESYFAFCASLRGLIESAADAWYTLRTAITTVEDSSRLFSSALTGDLNDILLGGPDNETLESLLMHFHVARGMSKREAKLVPEHFEALNTYEYLKHATSKYDEVNYVHLLYKDLCQITHPAALTVDIYVRELEVGPNYRFSIKSGDSKALIKDTVRRHPNALQRLIGLAIDPAYATFNITNEMPLEELHIDLHPST